MTEHLLIALFLAEHPEWDTGADVCPSCGGFQTRTSAIAFANWCVDTGVSEAKAVAPFVRRLMAQQEAIDQRELT